MMSLVFSILMSFAQAESCFAPGYYEQFDLVSLERIAPKDWSRMIIVNLSPLDEVNAGDPRVLAELIASGRAEIVNVHLNKRGMTIAPDGPLQALATYGAFEGATSMDELMMGVSRTPFYRMLDDRSCAPAD